MVRLHFCGGYRQLLQLSVALGRVLHVAKEVLEFVDEESFEETTA